MHRQVILSALAVVICVALCGCSGMQDLLSMKKPTASLAGLSLSNISLDSTVLLFDVEVDNPYSVPLPLINLDYIVASGERKLFSGAADLQSSIPANGKAKVSLPVKLGYADVYNAFKGFKLGSSIPYSADVGLGVKTPLVGSLRMPLNKTGELAVPDLASLKNIDWQKVLTDTVNKPK